MKWSSFGHGTITTLLTDSIKVRPPARTRQFRLPTTVTENKLSLWIHLEFEETIMNRVTKFAYGLFSYAVFFATFLYAIGFIGNFFVPKSIDSAPNVPLAQALLINLGLLTLFAIQHSVMARPFFKRWITRFISPAIERSTYVLASSIALIGLFVFWEPMGGVVWNITHPVGTGIMYAGFAFGWVLILISTFVINHFDLFGLRQVWLDLRKIPYSPLHFETPFLYRLVRHPLYLGWFFALWCTPVMTVAHLVFALACTAYILAAIQWEERDLLDAHPEYRAYRQQVPMIIPFRGKRHNGISTTAAAGSEA
jgi:protein-S-isoprenylcysteine O-methyltransferase Ste14